MINRAANTPFLWGMKVGAPIAVGYFPIAISFGIISLEAGLSLGETVAMSLFVYAGASQFMAVNMLFLGAAGLEVVLATFVLNLRHLVMSMSLINTWDRIPRRYQMLLSLGITDETFALASLQQNGHHTTPHWRLMGMMVAAYSSWVSGTLVGAGLFLVIPVSIGNSMSIALYAMFIALLVPAAKQSRVVIIIAAVGAGVSTLLVQVLPEGWSIVLATMAAATIGALLGGDQRC